MSRAWSRHKRDRRHHNPGRPPVMGVAADKRLEWPAMHASNPWPAHVERLWSKVDIRGPAECWPWMAGCVNGYGSIGYRRDDGKWAMRTAPRMAWEMMHGRLTRGQGEVVRHLCDNRGCVNPSHLVIGSYADNAEDRDAWRSSGFRATLDRQTRIEIGKAAKREGVTYAEWWRRAAVQRLNEPSTSIGLDGDEVLAIRVPADWLALIAAQAEAAGITVSHWLRLAALGAAATRTVVCGYCRGRLVSLSPSDAADYDEAPEDAKPQHLCSVCIETCRAHARVARAERATG